MFQLKNQCYQIKHLLILLILSTIMGGNSSVAKRGIPSDKLGQKVEEVCVEQSDRTVNEFPSVQAQMKNKQKINEDEGEIILKRNRKLIILMFLKCLVALLLVALGILIFRAVTRAKPQEPKPQEPEPEPQVLEPPEIFNLTCRTEVSLPTVENPNYSFSQTWYKDIYLVEKPGNKFNEVDFYNGVAEYFRENAIGESGVLYQFDSPMLISILGKVVANEQSIYVVEQDQKTNKFIKKNAVINDVQPKVKFTQPPSNWLPSLVVSDKVIATAAPQLLVLRTAADAAQVTKIDPTINVRRLEYKNKGCGYQPKLIDVPDRVVTQGLYLLTKK